jgi:adenylate cyclase
MNRRKVLIVDDDEPIRRLIGAMIERDGYDPLLADSGESALVTTSTNHVEAFLLDINLPGMSGFSLCRKIREIQQYQTAPILFVTSTVNNLEDAFAAGCDDLINKPIDSLVLRARLKAHIQRAEYAQLLSSTRRMLDQYVSKRTREIAEKAAMTGVLPSPIQREVVILFTDIRGFTALSEEIAPDELFSLISTELAMQVHLIYRHGGYVDKFGGDGLMAVFDSDEMVTQSCLCALEIMETVHQRTGHHPRMPLCIGIHLGSVVIGNIGSPEHFDYSVIGSAVNLAARLCGHATPMSIIVSKAVRDAAIGDNRLRFDFGQEVPIRGLKDLVTVYKLAPARRP